MTGASVAPLYPTLRDRVVHDASWKMFAACGTRPAMQCQNPRCKKFDSGVALCKCKTPKFEPLTEEAWVAFWYPDRGADFAAPKKICNQSCQVRKACLAYALANHEVFGIWGGHTERERRRLRMGRSLWVVCVYCNGSVKAGQWTRKTCNRTSCKDRWADERSGAQRPAIYSTCEHCGFEIVADEPTQVCNAQACRDWLETFAETDVFAESANSPEPEHTYVIIGQEFFDLEDVVVEGLPHRVSRGRSSHPASLQLTMEDLF